jgi:hypothetical protein
MNEPASQAGLPANFLKIQGDPTSWGLRTTPPRDGWHDTPVALDLTSPVAGILILSPARVASYSLTAEIWANGWEHGGNIKVVSPYLYIPSTAGLTADSHGYPLAAQHDLPALQRSILDAMTRGSTLTVNLDVLGSGTVILNGAQLPFAVLAT